MRDRVEDFDYDDNDDDGSSLADEVVSSGYEGRPKSSSMVAVADWDLLCSALAPDDKAEDKESAPEAAKDAAAEKVDEYTAQYNIVYAGRQLQYRLQQLQDQLDEKIPRPDRTGQPLLSAQIREVNKEIEKVQKKISPFLTPDEKVELTKELNKCVLQVCRIQYGLPPGATDEKIWDEIRKDEAKKLGLPADASFKDIDAAYEKKAFESDCKFYGLDPKTATAKQLEDAVKRREFERECDFYKIDPKKSTQLQLEEAREQYGFEKDCKEHGLDPKTTTREECKKVREFHIDCHLFKVNPKDADAPQKIHKARCAYWGLPETATQKEIDERIKDREKANK